MMMLEGINTGQEKYRNTVGRFLTAGEHTIDTDDGRRANDSAVSG